MILFMFQGSPELFLVFLFGQYVGLIQACPQYIMHECSQDERAEFHFKYIINIRCHMKVETPQIGALGPHFYGKKGPGFLFSYLGTPGSPFSW